MDCRYSSGGSSDEVLTGPLVLLDFQRQYARNPARCQRMIVSGLTIARASYAFGNDRQAAASISRSIAPKKSLFGAARRRTLICCRRTSSSASRAARDRNRSVTIPTTRRHRSNIGLNHRPILIQHQPDWIYGRDRRSNTFSANRLLLDLKGETKTASKNENSVIITRS